MVGAWVSGLAGQSMLTKAPAALVASSDWIVVLDPVVMVRAAWMRRKFWVVPAGGSSRSFVLVANVGGVGLVPSVG